MPTETRTDAVAMMAERLEHAVETDGSVDLLENWLQGFDLPPLGVEEEPYVWIMRGLSETVDRVQCERALAIWLAEWFRRKPDVERRGEYPDQVLYNAFFLAAGLASPDELAGSLLEMYERRQLSGDHLGIDHRGSLRSALSQNQLDARLEPVWRAMATGKETDFLPGNPYNGFEALAMMPDPVKGRGHPALEALGEALTHLVRRLDKKPEARDSRFKRLLGRLLSLYPSEEVTILDHMRQVAEEQEWPAWVRHRCHQGGQSIDETQDCLEDYGTETGKQIINLAALLVTCREEGGETCIVRLKGQYCLLALNSCLNLKEGDLVGGAAEHEDCMILGESLIAASQKLPEVLERHRSRFEPYRQLLKAVNEGLAPAVLRKICQLPFLWRRKRNALRIQYGSKPGVDQEAQIQDYTDSAALLQGSLEQLLEKLHSRKIQHRESLALYSDLTAQANLNQCVSLLSAFEEAYDLMENTLLPELFQPLEPASVSSLLTQLALVRRVGS